MKRGRQNWRKMMDFNGQKTSKAMVKILGKSWSYLQGSWFLGIEAMKIRCQSEQEWPKWENEDASPIRLVGGTRDLLFSMKYFVWLMIPNNEYSWNMYKLLIRNAQFRALNLVYGVLDIRGLPQADYSQRAWNDCSLALARSGLKPAALTGTRMCNYYRGPTVFQIPDDAESQPTSLQILQLEIRLQRLSLWVRAAAFAARSRQRWLFQSCQVMCESQLCAS